MPSTITTTTTTGARRGLVALALACAAVTASAACSRGDADGRAATADGDGAAGPSSWRSEAPAAGITASPYRAVALGATGGVRGSVTLLAGEAAADSAMPVPEADQGACRGVTARTESLDRAGDRLGGVVVWLTGVPAGKRLPITRRFDIELEHCRMTPRVQAAVAGGTLNVRSLDGVLHRTTLARQRDGAPLGEVTQYDPGQVVPVTKPLAAAGMVEVRCTQHPWERAWLAVFDHPYHEVTRRDGGFAIDSVPPGSYTLVAWHERFGAVQRKVTIAAGEPAQVDLELGRATPAR